jgi:nitrogen fixation protein NifZ
MMLEDLQPGDVVYAAAELFNDGFVPDLPADALIAQAGTRGVVINTGHLEEDPEQTIYLVRFEGGDLTLGPPIGCLPEELSAGKEQAAP